jgi:hypothetical protein
MKRAVLILAITVLALPAAALAKGPSAATIDGPGVGGGGGSDITITGCCAPETATMKLAEQAGFFPAAFARQPDPMLDKRPRGDLGPRYTITYSVPGAEFGTDEIRQDVYPYAMPGPVTYMAPGQKLFGSSTRGGWFRADARLKKTLVEAGLPRTASAALSGDDPFPLDVVALYAAGLALVAATLVLLRRRMRPAARMAGSPS